MAWATNAITEGRALHGDRSGDVESGSTCHRGADRRGLDDRRLPGRQVAEAAAAVDVVPELGRDHAGQGDVEDEPGRGEAGEDGLAATAA